MVKLKNMSLKSPPKRHVWHKSQAVTLFHTVERHEKGPPTFHYAGWLIGILKMVYYNPYKLGSIIPYITQPTKVFFSLLEYN